MDLLLIAAGAVPEACEKIAPVIRIVKGLFNILRILIPIALLIFGALDLAKAVIASDEKEIKGATTKFVKRAVAAVAVFFAVTLVNIIMGLIGSGSDDGSGSTVTSEDWFKCWDTVSAPI